MRSLKKYGIHINKHFYTKKNFFSKNPHIVGVKNFNGVAKYDKTTNFNLEHFFIQNYEALLNDVEHQDKPIYKLIHKLIFYIAVKC